MVIYQTLIKHRVQISLFILAGAMSALIEISAMKFFSLPQSLPSIFSFESRKYGYPLSNVFSTSLGIISNYFFSIWFVFKRGKHSKRKEMLYFVLLSIITMFMSWGLFAFFHSYIHKPVKILFITLGDIVFCKAAAIVVVSVVNYISKKKLVFSS